MDRRRLFGFLGAIGANAIFGLSFLFSRTALDRGVPVFPLLGLRFLVAFAGLSVLIATGVLRVSYRGKPVLRLLPLVAFQPILYFLCETNGILRTSSSEAGILISLLPIVTVVLAYLFLGERLSPPQVASVLVSIAGAILIIVLSGFRPTFDPPGILLLLGAVLSAAAFNVLSRNLSRTFSSVEMTYAMMATGALSFGLPAAVRGFVAGDPAALLRPLGDPAVLVSILYLGLASSICAFVLLIMAVRRMGASRTSSLANIATVVSIAAGTLVLRESLAWYHFVGSTLIIAGVWGANRPWKPVPAGV